MSWMAGLGKFLCFDTASWRGAGPGRAQRPRGAGNARTQGAGGRRREAGGGARGGRGQPDGDGREGEAEGRRPVDARRTGRGQHRAQHGQTAKYVFWKSPDEVESNYRRRRTIAASNTRAPAEPPHPMASWHSLPTELRLAVIAELGPHDVDSLAKTSLASYRACVPARFRSVKLDDFLALQRFLANVPRSYCSSIESLELATHDEDLFAPTHVTLRERSDAVIALLSACSRLSSLVLRVAGSLHSSVVAPFPHLANLKNLSISNVSAEEYSPLSERLVVAIAASCPALQELSLDRVTRSELHAPDLKGVPYIPLVRGDEDVPDHPLLGSQLRLPSLLRLSTLRKLAIRDTHLGDEHWSSTPVACRLQVLDLGSYYHENEDFNQSCTETIMSAVGPTVDTFSLNTAVCNDRLFAKPSETPLQKLRKLHITPFFPVDSVVETISNLAGSPIETLSMQCYEDDVVDVCNALEEFLTVKLERGAEFYDKLNRINVSVTPAGYPATDEEVDERKTAAKKLQDFCRQMRLASEVDSYGVPQRPVSSSRRASMSFAVEVGVGATSTPAQVRPAGKARSMTLH